MLKLVVVFATSVFLSLNFGSLLYVNSTYLSQFFSSSGVSALFMLGALGNLILFCMAPRLSRYLPKVTLLHAFVFILFISNLWLAWAVSPLSAALAFVTYTSFIYLAYYCIDILIEELSTDSSTGELRGLYGTFMNAGIAAGPLLVAYLVSDDSLENVYIIGAVLLIITLIMTRFDNILGLNKSSKKDFHPHTLTLPWKLWWHKVNIRRVTLAKLVLEIFFGLMVIYTPLYLHGELGFNWQELGVIFMVALLPFVLFEWPVGELADRKWGEKEMMSIGFFITGISLLIMPFLDKMFWDWLLILFLSRLGASVVEITTDSYFFKQEEASDTGFLSIFRAVRPLGVILGAGLGALSLMMVSFPAMFFILAFVVFLGIRESAYLKDTL